MKLISNILLFSYRRPEQFFACTNENANDIHSTTTEFTKRVSIMLYKKFLYKKKSALIPETIVWQGSEFL